MLKTNPVTAYRQSSKLSILFGRSYHMNPMTYKVMDIMLRDGGITHMTALHYGIGSITKEIARLRHAFPYGYKIVTVTRKDAEGNKYTRWTLKKVEG